MYAKCYKEKVMVFLVYITELPSLFYRGLGKLSRVSSTQGKTKMRSGISASWIKVLGGLVGKEPTFRKT